MVEEFERYSLTRADDPAAGQQGDARSGWGERFCVRDAWAR